MCVYGIYSISAHNCFQKSDHAPSLNGKVSSKCCLHPTRISAKDIILLQSKPKTPAKKRPQKGQRKSPRRTSSQPDSPYVNPDEETAEASFDKPARVRMLTTATKVSELLAGPGPSSSFPFLIRDRIYG